MGEIESAFMSLNAAQDELRACVSDLAMFPHRGPEREGLKRMIRSKLDVVEQCVAGVGAALDFSTADDLNTTHPRRERRPGAES